jgi:hypothetical protein
MYGDHGGNRGNRHESILDGIQNEKPPRRLSENAHDAIRENHMRTESALQTSMREHKEELAASLADGVAVLGLPSAA